MVVFKDDPQEYNDQEVFEMVQHQISLVMGLNKQILKMDEEIMLNPVVRVALMGGNCFAPEKGSFYCFLFVTVC